MSEPRWVSRPTFIEVLQGRVVIGRVMRVGPQWWVAQHLGEHLGRFRSRRNALRAVYRAVGRKP